MDTVWRLHFKRTITFLCICKQLCINKDVARLIAKIVYEFPLDFTNVVYKGMELKRIRYIVYWKSNDILQNACKKCLRPVGADTCSHGGEVDFSYICEGYLF